MTPKPAKPTTREKALRLPPLVDRSALIETQGSAATDTITQIVGLGYAVARLRLLTNGRTVTIEHNAPAICLPDGMSSIVLSSLKDTLWIEGVGSDQVVYVHHALNQAS